MLTSTLILKEQKFQFLKTEYIDFFYMIVKINKIWLFSTPYNYEEVYEYILLTYKMSVLKDFI